VKRPKVIYLARRNKELSAEAFVERWKKHGQLAMSLPVWRNMWRYIHCDPIKVGQTSARWDGVGLVWYRSWEALASIAAETSLRQPLLDDELLTFSDHVRNTAILTEETVVRDGPETDHKMMVFYSEDTDPSKLALASATRIVRNDRVKNEYTQQSLLTYRGVLEYWFPTNMDARRALGQTTRSEYSSGTDALLVETRWLYSD